MADQKKNKKQIDDGDVSLSLDRWIDLTSEDEFLVIERGSLC